MRVQSTGITPAHLEADGSGRGTAGMPRVGSWAAIVRLLWPRRRMATYIARSARLAGPVAVKGSAPTVAPSRASLASRPRRRLQRALGRLGTTQAEHLERRVLLAGDSFDSGMNPEAWIIPCYEPSAEMCVPAGERGSYSPSYHEPSASFPLDLAMFESDPGMPYSDSHSEPYLGSMEWIAYDSPPSQPAIDHVASGYPVWGSSALPWPEFTAEPADDVMAYSGTGSESGGPMDSASTVEPSDGLTMGEQSLVYVWMEGDETASADSPGRPVDGFAGKHSSDTTDPMTLGGAAETQDDNPSQVAFAQAGNPDDTGADPAQESPGVGPVAAPNPSEVPGTPRADSAYDNYVYVMHLTRLSSVENATADDPLESVRQEHGVIIVSGTKHDVTVTTTGTKAPKIDIRGFGHTVHIIIDNSPPQPPTSASDDWGNIGMGLTGPYIEAPIKLIYELGKEGWVWSDTWGWRIQFPGRRVEIVPGVWVDDCKR